MKREAAIQRLIEVCRRQHKSLSTERVYALWVGQFIDFLRRPEGAAVAGLPSEKKLEGWLTMLALKRNVSASTQNQAFNAVLFFYKQVLEQPLKDVKALRATRPKRERYAISQAETLKLLELVPNVAGYPTKLIARMLYACGLRLADALNLRVKDLRLDEGKLFIFGGKGDKDRVVRLPCVVVGELQEQLVYSKTIFARDVAARTPLMLPGRLAVKYPSYQFSWPWAWVFPQHFPCADPRDNSGRMVRYHLHEANVQRAVKRAASLLGHNMTPHHLRHCYATHVLERGANIKGVQAAMGHVSLETTQGYVHAEALDVRSPLEVLA